MSKVSIHAPVKGTTPGGVSPPGVAVCFNPRSREGNDMLEGWSEDQLKAFQSTLP